jgi:F-type H+-transporting ATPase subunit gamma
MASLKKIQEKLIGVKKTSKVTKAMESISAIKMRAAQKKALDGREYSFLVFSILKRISKVVGRNVDEIFSQVLPEGGKTIILLISPDKGLTGGMNNFLFKKVTNTIMENELSHKNLSFVCVGKKGYEFVGKSGYEVEKYFESISEKSQDEEIEEVSKYVEQMYREGKYSRVISIYTNFVNTAEQKPVARTILPVVYDELKTFVKDIVPNKGKFSDAEEIDIDHSDVAAYIFEPSIEAAMASLVPFVLHISVFNSLLESFASEHSSRMIAMKNSTDKANELAEDLRRKFNKERQAQITKEISEIVSGIEAMKD